MVFYHPWYSPEYEILSLEKAAQSQYSHRSHKLGGAVPIEDVHDSYVMVAANVAITELNRRSNSLFKTVLVEILHGTVQASYCCIYHNTLQSMHYCSFHIGMIQLQSYMYMYIYIQFQAPMLPHVHNYT